MLSKKQRCIVTGRQKQAEQQAMPACLLGLTTLGTLVRHFNHLSYPDGSKPSPPTFFVLTNSGRFDLCTSLLQTRCPTTAELYKSWSSLKSKVHFGKASRQASKQSDKKIGLTARAHSPRNTCRAL